MLHCSHPNFDHHAKPHRLVIAWTMVLRRLADLRFLDLNSLAAGTRLASSGGLYRVASTVQSVYKLWKDHHKLQSKTCLRLQPSLQAGPDFFRDRQEPRPHLVQRAAGARARALVLAERPPGALSNPWWRADAGMPRVGA